MLYVAIYWRKGWFACSGQSHARCLLFYLLYNLEFTYSSYLPQGCWKKPVVSDCHVLESGRRLLWEDRRLKQTSSFSPPTALSRFSIYLALLDIKDPQSTFPTNPCMYSLSHFKFYLSCWLHLYFIYCNFLLISMLKRGT